MSRAATVAGFGALACAAAAGFGVASLYVLGFSFVLIGAGCAAWVCISACTTRISRVLGPSTVEEGAAYPLEVRFDRGPLPLPGGELLDPLIGRAVAPPRRRSARLRGAVRFARRGRRSLPPSVLRVRDPLGLAERVVRSRPASVIVLPRVEPVRDSSTAIAGVAGGVNPLSGEQAELELDSLRPYRDGAPASRIHWPTVARRGTVMERRLVADSERGPLIVIDPRRPASADALDRALRAGASLCVHLARRGGCALLLPGDARPTRVGRELRGWALLHVRLALVEPTDRPPAARALQRSGPIFWVTAGVSAPVELMHTSAAVRLVAPTAVPGMAREFSVAGCLVQRARRDRRRAA